MFEQPRELANDHHAKPGDPRAASLRKCPACGRGFYINDGHRTYGRDACKQAAYRFRKLQTREARRAAARQQGTMLGRVSGRDAFDVRNASRGALRTIARNG